MMRAVRAVAVMALASAAVTALPSAAVAVPKDKAMFVGGTVPGLPEKTEGRVDATDTAKLTFYADKNAGTITVPWKKVQSIEYGQNVSRRWKTALLTPWALLSKGRKHFVTIEYKDEQNTAQAVVFEFGKDIYRTALSALKVRSGKDVVCQDDEAKKQMGGACTVAKAD